MTQWDRRYRVLVHSRAGGRALDVSQLRCRFEIYKNLDEEPNYSVVTIYNLSGASEKSILENGASVTVEAGYENAAFGLIFSGEIIQWARGREDGTDKYLRLVCQDGDHLLTSAFVATTLARGATQEDIVAACLSGASAGRLDLAPGSLPRAKTLFGMNRDYLHQAAVTAGGKLYVENGVANIVSASFASAALCADLRPDTGLIGIARSMIGLRRRSGEMPAQPVPRSRTRACASTANTSSRRKRAGGRSFPPCRRTAFTASAASTIWAIRAGRSGIARSKPKTPPRQRAATTRQAIRFTAPCPALSRRSTKTSRPFPSGWPCAKRCATKRARDTRKRKFPSCRTCPSSSRGRAGGACFFPSKRATNASSSSATAASTAGGSRAGCRARPKAAATIIPTASR